MLADKLRAHIRADGPMPFEDYMAACLYDERFGFFTMGPLRSVKEGDFLTSPEVSPWFGRMLARFVVDEQQRIGADPFLVVEAGAGSGSLLKPLMDELAELTAHRSQITARFHAIEASPAAREALTRLLGSATVHTSLDDLPGRFDGVIVANELLDNLPVALAIRSGDGWVERWVGATEDHFGFVTAPVRPEVAVWCDAYAGTVAEGGMVEVQLAAVEWVEAALERIDHGALVVIDYGGTAEELEPRRTQGTLRTYRSHHLGPDPLLEPGATDVTVDVNFTAMMAAVGTRGATVELHRQDDFLASLGLRDVVGELRHRERDLARDGEAMERLIVRSEATDTETLLHPRGLGDFRVMVARTP
ncbi:MAG: SAM-dependent methyltransferase [Actinomycetota bacterium]|nr:SAM-dependent methyltransferase [Actinomycetota bacterium]